MATLPRGLTWIFNSYPLKSVIPTRGSLSASSTSTRRSLPSQTTLATYTSNRHSLPSGMPRPKLFQRRRSDATPPVSSALHDSLANCTRLARGPAPLEIHDRSSLAPENRRRHLLRLGADERFHFRRNQ